MSLAESTHGPRRWAIRLWHVGEVWDDWFYTQPTNKPTNRQQTPGTDNKHHTTNNKKTNKQTNKQTNKKNTKKQTKQSNKKTNKQTNKQTKKQRSGRMKRRGDSSHSRGKWWKYRKLQYKKRIFNVVLAWNQLSVYRNLDENHAFFHSFVGGHWAYGKNGILELECAFYLTFGTFLEVCIRFFFTFALSSA